MVARTARLRNVVELRRFEDDDSDAVVAMALRAWGPVFASTRQVMGDQLFTRLHGDDWQAYQEREVRATCAGHATWVAWKDNEVAGFVAVNLHPARGAGEVLMLAVDPNQQRAGVGRRLIDFAVQTIAAAGMSLVIIETGGDDGHAPARAAYASAGLIPVSAVRYFQVVEARMR